MAGAPARSSARERPLVTHGGEHGAHVSTITLARPHTLRSKFGAAGVLASSLPEAGPTPPPRPGSLPAVPPTSYPRPPRRGSLPAGRSPTRRAAPQSPAAASPRHGTGPRLTMAAVRHSTLDFKLGAKGEGARPPPARPPAPPAGLGPAGTGRGARRGPNNADGPRGPGVSPAAAPSALRGRVHRRPGRRPRSSRSPPQRGAWRGRFPPQPSSGGAALRGPGRPPAPRAGVAALARVPFAPRGSGGTPPPTSAGPPLGRECRGGGRAPRGAARVTFSCSRRRVNSLHPGAGAPLVGAGAGAGARRACRILSRLRRRRVPRKGTGGGKGNVDYGGGR